MMRRLALVMSLALLVVPPAGHAAEPEPVPAPEVAPASVPIAAPAPDRGAERGAVTNLPIPRFVSLKAAEGNVRRGPSRTHRVDWVFKRRNMPLQVVGEYGHWRRVVDRDGAGGWMHYSLLSGARTAIVSFDRLPLHVRPDPGTRIVAYAEEGVVARLGNCAQGWCEVRIGGVEGWSPAAHLWGSGSPRP